MKIALISAVLFAVATSGTLAETNVTEAKSPMIERWEKFQAKKGMRVFDESPCTLGKAEGFRIVYSPDTGLDPEQNRDCKKVYK